MFHITERRKARQDESEYDSVIDEPANFNAPFVIPGNARLGYSFSAALVGQFINEEDEVVPSELLVTYGSRQLGCPDLAADEFHEMGFFEKGRTISYSSTVLGDISLFLIRDNGVRVLIATGDGSL